MHDAAKKAIVLLSGGLDSTVTAALAVKDGYCVTALTVDYGQRHVIEVNRARQIAEKLGIAQKVIGINLREFGGSSLTADEDVPHHPTCPQTDEQEVPITYVPARNLLLLSLAGALAEAIGAMDVFIGVNKVDYSGYPDCRADFLAAFEHALVLGTKTGRQGNGIRVRAPIVDMTKRQIVELGLALGAPLALTWTCYDPTSTGQPCGECDACHYRQKGFSQAGVIDPALVQIMKER